MSLQSYQRHTTPLGITKNIEEEIIDSAAHTQGGIPHSTFVSDNQKVDDILKNIVKDTNEWTWTEGRACFRNDWCIFTNLKTH